MDGATLQQRIATGYAKAAQKIGTRHDWYRGGMMNPTDTASWMGTMLAAWAVDAQFKTPPNYSTQLYRAFLDTNTAQPGDIFVGAQTFVLLESGPLIPPLGLICTDQIKIERQIAETLTAPGIQAYADPNELTTIAQGLPANVQIKKETGTIPANLPSDVSRRTYWTVSFYAPDGAVKDGDIVTDGEGYRYQVTAANWQSIYYQCLCERMEA